MKALSVYQPWASLIADRRKRVETKAWPIEYRGLVAIHASERVNVEACEQFGYDASKVARGAIVAIVNIKDCVLLPDKRVRKSKFGDFTPGRYAIVLEVQRKLRKPVVEKGHNKMWECSLDWHAIGKQSATK